MKLCSKANRKLCALSRMAKLLSLNKRRTLLKLLWSLSLNIVQLFGRFIVDVPTTKFIGYMREPLELLMIYKTLHDISGNCLKDLFVKRESTISLRCKPELVIPSVNSVLKGKNSLRYIGSVIWNSLPIEIREYHSISLFVTKIKQWKAIACPCTICKSYLCKVGYIKVSDY